MATISSESPRKTISVYQINVIEQRIIRVNYDGSLKQLYQLIDCETLDSIARQANGDGIFCNDLLPADPQQAAFRLRSTGQIIYGNGVWTGSNREGDTTAPTTQFEHVCEEVEFLGLIPYKQAPIFFISW